jgi:hypothetical protein
MRNLDSLLQKRNGRLVFAPLTETCAGKTIYCSPWRAVPQVSGTGPVS